MTPPDEVRWQVNEALSAMRADPQHHVPPARRRAIYTAFGPPADDLSDRARGWLAVLSAQRVLPIWHNAFPDDTLPQEILDMACALLQGTGDDEAAAELQDLGYHASGNAWGYDEEDVPWNVHTAANTAYHALKEVRGWEPLAHLGNYLLLGTVVLAAGSDNSADGTVIRLDPPITGDQFSDEELCQVDSADVAATAAVATACEPDRPRCHPSKLQGFWEWWLLEAIPTAWARANAGRGADSDGG